MKEAIKLKKDAFWTWVLVADGYCLEEFREAMEKDFQLASKKWKHLEM